MTSPDLDLEALRKVAEAATQKAWTVWPNSETYVRENTSNGWGVFSGRHRPDPEAAANARHAAIFNPPTAIALLDRLTAAEAENAALKSRIEALEKALETCRLTIKEQSLAATLDPTMPLLRPEIVKSIRDEAEAQWACAENGKAGAQDRIEAHGRVLLCDWQDRARSTLSGGGE